MRSPTQQAGKFRLTARDITLTAVLGVVLYVLQVAMGFLPNIELVSFSVILFTLVFGKRIIGILAVFILLEGITYGFGSWWIMYLYIWPLLAGLTCIFRRMDSSLGWAVLSGAFGLAFGFLCSITYLFIGGIGGAIAYFVQGMIFDVLHCGGNFILMLLLYKKLRQLLEKLNSKFTA